MAYFVAQRWFSREAGLEAVLDGSANNPLLEYRVSVHTHDMPGADCDGHVYLDIVGDHGAFTHFGALGAQGFWGVSFICASVRRCPRFRSRSAQRLKKGASWWTETIPLAWCQ